MTACTFDPLCITLGKPTVQPNPCYGSNRAAARCPHQGAIPGSDRALATDQGNRLSGKFENLAGVDQQAVSG